MSSNTNNVKLGVCRVIYDGVDLGYTKGGVEVEVQTETHEVNVDQFGKTPINEIVMGRMVSAKVPLAETTLDNLVRIMPGATLVQTGGAKATGTVTFVTSAPVNGDAVVVNGIAYTFKTTPAAGKVRELAIPASIAAAAAALAAAVNLDTANPVSATAAAGVTTLTADIFGAVGNAYALTKVGGTNITLSAATLSGGTDSTAAKVNVPTGIGIDLLSIAKRLVLHPSQLDDADFSEDFVIPLASTSGALSFAYKLEDERVFNVTFKGYPNSQTQVLFVVGNENAA